MAKISKIDAARRHLDAAIQLWLDDGDVVVTHTLHMAAFGVLNDLDKRENPEWHKKFWESLPKIVVAARREVANFLKHADRDPEAHIDEPIHDQWEWSIGLTVSIYRRVTRNKLTPLMTAFDLMMKSAWPEYFNIVADDDPDVEAGAQLGARLLRADPQMRRIKVRGLLIAIEQGAIDTGADLRRKLPSRK